MNTTRLKQNVVTETVREWILQGKYSPGDRLPTDVELAQQLLVNKGTIAAGLNRLVEENLLERAPKRGSIVKMLSNAPKTNAVGLMTLDSGAFYCDFFREINRYLHEKDLFPIFMDGKFFGTDSEHITDVIREEITQFLRQVVKKSQPYGYLILGDNFVPYEELKKAPYCLSNIVFMLRYHHYEEFSHCHYVLIDYEDLGRQVVEYYANHNIKRLIFAAMREKNYRGAHSSMQVQILKGILKYAPEAGLEFDEGLFWRLHSGAPVSALLPPVLESSDIPTGIFGWLDSTLTSRIFPVIKAMGRDPVKDYLMLGNFDTHAMEYGFDTFDLRVTELAKIGVDMLTGEIKERKILLPPKLIEYTKKNKKL